MQFQTLYLNSPFHKTNVRIAYPRALQKKKKKHP